MTNALFSRPTELWTSGCLGYGFAALISGKQFIVAPRVMNSL